MLGAQAKVKAGLAGDDPRREAKLAIMKELLQQNRELRRALAIELGQPAEPLARAEVSAEVDVPVFAPADAEADVDPDDLPWQPPSDPAPAGGAEGGQIKVVRDFKTFEPPELAKR
jgi:hypothetical protein